MRTRIDPRLLLVALCVPALALAACKKSDNGASILGVEHVVVDAVEDVDAIPTDIAKAV